MPRYKYQAIDNTSGKTIKDTALAEDVSGVAALLRQRGLSIVAIDNNPVQEDSPVVAPEDVLESKPLLDSILLYLSPVKKDEILLLLKQLAALIAGGLSVVESLTVLEEQTTHRGLKKLIGAIRSDVESGWPLSAALEKFPKNFPRFVTSIIKTGETSGLLDETMNEVVNYMEAAAALRRQLIKAFIYPVIVLVLTIALVFFMALYVIPQIIPFIQGGGGELPESTRLLIEGTNFLINNAANIGIAAVGVIVLLVVLYKIPFIREFLDRYSMLLPVFGAILQCGVVTKFSKTLHLLISSGLPITEALHATAETMENTAVRKALANISEAVLSGLNLSDGMKQTGILFPPLVITAVKVGEETGNLDRSLQMVNGMYSDLLQRKIKAMTAMIEPMTIIFLGAIVGFVALALVSGMMAGYQ